MRYYSLLLIGLALLSCQKDSPTPEPLPPHEITLVYMVADNDLACLKRPQRNGTWVCA